MSWQEHENEYCKIINNIPNDYISKEKTYSDAVNRKNNIEISQEYGILTFDVVKCENLYYIIPKKD